MWTVSHVGKKDITRWIVKLQIQKGTPLHPQNSKAYFESYFDVEFLNVMKRIKQGELVKLGGELAGVSVEFLIDGGSTITLLSGSIWDQISERFPSPPMRIERPIRVEVGSGEYVLVSEGIHLDGHLDGQKVQYFFGIFRPRREVFKCLIGQDFLNQLGLVCVPTLDDQDREVR